METASITTMGMAMGTDIQTAMSITVSSMDLVITTDTTAATAIEIIQPLRIAMVRLGIMLLRCVSTLEDGIDNPGFSDTKTLHSAFG